MHNLQAQELTLHLTAKDSIHQVMLDSIGYQKQHRSLHSITQELNTLTQALKTNGYINAYHSKIKTPLDSVVNSVVYFGTQYKTIQLTHQKGSIPFLSIKENVLHKTDTSFTVKLQTLEKTLQHITDYLSNQGRPFTNLHISEITPLAGGTLSGVLIIEQSKIRQLDSIVIKGYKKFPRVFLQYYSNLKKGQPFNKAKIDQQTQHLKSLSFASLIRPAEVLFTDQKTTLYLYLKKQPSNHFEGFLGFSTNETTHALELNGDLSLRLVNNLNYGETFALHYKNNGTDRQHFNVQLELPYLFSTPIGLNLELDLLRQDSTYTTNSQIAKLSYQLTPTLSFSAGYQGTTSNSIRSNDLIAGQVIRDYTASFLTLGSVFFKRNSSNELYPIHAKLALDFGIGKRKDKLESSPQQWVKFSGQYLYNIDHRHAIYFANWTAVLFSENYLDNELFRFGGITSIRGFSENSIPASFYSSIQLEYRYLLSQNLYIHSITDYANFKNANLQINQNLYGIGLGLGLKTKAGLLKIDFANGKTDGEKFEFNNTKVHLSLTATF